MCLCCHNIGAAGVADDRLYGTLYPSAASDFDGVAIRITLRFNSTWLMQADKCAAIVYIPGMSSAWLVIMKGGKRKRGGIDSPQGLMFRYRNAAYRCS